MTEAKAIAKTKFTVFKFTYRAAYGEDNYYFWINEEGNDELIDKVLQWANEYFSGSWRTDYETYVLSTPDIIREIAETPMCNDTHRCIMKQVKQIPEIPVSDDESAIPHCVLKTLSELGD
jgi:hypothetical protein